MAIAKKKRKKKPAKKRAAKAAPPLDPTVPRCGSKETKSGRPCGQVRLPCRFHDPTRKEENKQRKLPDGARRRREVLVDKIVEGATAADAARAAGFSESVARAKIYHILKEPEVQEMLAARRNAVLLRMQEAYGFDKNELIGVLVSLLRADIYYIMPDNPLVAAAHERGVSHLIKRVKERQRALPQGTGKPPIIETTTEVELHNILQATKQLANVFGMEGQAAPLEKIQRSFEEAVNTVFEKAQAIGLKITRERTEQKLRGLLGDPNSHAVN